RPVDRVLIPLEPPSAGGTFLDSALAWCEALRAEPVVLALGRSEYEAAACQQLAERAFAARGRWVDGDLFAGRAFHSAVGRAARWRNCSHVFLERQPAAPWWRRFRGDDIQQMLALADSLTVLSLPAAPLSKDRNGLATPAASMAAPSR